MLSLGFLSLGHSNRRAAWGPLRLAIPAFRMPANPAKDAPSPKQPLSREEITAAFADLLGPDALWTPRERSEQAVSARARAALYS